MTTLQVLKLKHLFSYISKKGLCGLFDRRKRHPFDWTSVFWEKERMMLSLCFLHANWNLQKWRIQPKPAFWEQRQSKKLHFGCSIWTLSRGLWFTTAFSFFVQSTDIHEENSKPSSFSFALKYGTHVEAYPFSLCLHIHSSINIY